jgi:hypothetical protein
MMFLQLVKITFWVPAFSFWMPVISIGKPIVANCKPFFSNLTSFIGCGYSFSTRALSLIVYRVNNAIGHPTSLCNNEFDCILYMQTVA